MNGNITKDGLKLDLEWMHRIGIAGFQTFDASLGVPQVVDRRLAYMTPEWKDAFKYATTLADQMGMDEGIAGSPGWSESGGPWVASSEGMKKYVWSETYVEGGRHHVSRLAHPPANTGAIQNMGIRYQEPPEGALPIPEFYADAAVVAYRRAPSDVPFQYLHPSVTASAGSPDFAMLSDGDLESTTKLPIPGVGESSWIQYEFPNPQTIRSITIVTREPDDLSAMLSGFAAPRRSLEASDDGVTFREVVELSRSAASENTISFSAVTARYFRVTFHRPPAPSVVDWVASLDPSSYRAFGIKVGPSPTNYEIAELVLNPGARVNRFEEKAGFAPQADLYGFATQSVDATDVINKSDVVDLTGKMDADGILDWTPPPGDWVVLRFGYSLLGAINEPATAESTGLEVDKLDRRFVKRYFDTYLDTYKDAVGSDWMGGRGLRAVVSDSWEAGTQNWTDEMIAQFKRLRGYDPIPWMPVLTGRVVDSAEASDRFLWDFRKTIADLVAVEHYGQLEATLHDRKMIHYGESHESGRAFIGDGMEVKKYSEVPMSAMWAQMLGSTDEQFVFDADDRESASVAHIYGQNLAAAESMSTDEAPWAWSPSTLKPTADMELANGINLFMIHESTHQPLLSQVPGLTLGPFGQWFNRNETWAEQAGPWIDYLARSSYMLQQGRFSADLIYFYGEDSNLTAIFSDKAPDVPSGYGFDYVNADALIHALSVANGRIVTPGGMSYRLLGLDPYSRHMSLPVLRAIYKLVSDGAMVAGPKPTDDPSLADDREEFDRLSDELFGDGTEVHTLGKGRVFAGHTPKEVFEALNVAPDFSYAGPTNGTHLIFVHRKVCDRDIYFVDNRTNRRARVRATFRVSGREPELWNAETGKTAATSFNIADGRTTVPLDLEPWGTTFVVFGTVTNQASQTLPEAKVKRIARIKGDWILSFQPNRGAPPSITADRLFSWAESSNPGVKYFSGTGTYSKVIDAKSEWLKNGKQIWIDLGDVKNLAEVLVNGQPLGILWHAPYRADVTAALRPGRNELTIKVTNAWVNRLIGDRQPGAPTKFTYTTVEPYNAKSPLLPSGLIGPVQLYSADNR